MCDVAFCPYDSEFINTESGMKYCEPHAMIIGYEITHTNNDKVKLIKIEAYLKSLPNYKTKEQIKIEKKLQQIKKLVK
jgi:hypothetical protein